MKDDSAERDVAAARQATDALAELLLERIDPFWWSHTPNDLRAGDLRDYTYGVVRSAGSNLVGAVTALRLLEKTRYAQDHDSKIYTRSHGTGMPPNATPRSSERALEITLYSRAILVDVGAALDCLAGAVISILGLPVNVRVADLGTLYTRPFAPEWRHSRRLTDARAKSSANDALRGIQDRGLAGLQRALQDAGPDGWLDWSTELRNTFVHRERRVDFINHDIRSPKHHEISYLPPRSPSYSNIEALRAGGIRLRDYFLMEDSTTTFRGVLGSTARAVTSSVATLTTGFEERIVARPKVDWRTQWPGSRLIAQPFDGYAPGSVRVDPNARLYMNPTDAKRMREADLITPD